jgi:hypothetical protein
MKSKVSRIFLLFVMFFGFCAAEPSSEEKTDTGGKIVMKKTLKNGLTAILFSKNNTTFYRMLFKDVIYQRCFVSGSKVATDLKVQEYDFDYDGKLDAIQIGVDDSDFTPFIVSIHEGSIEIEALPENWKSGSKYPYDAFISYVKNRKGIKQTADQDADGDAE